MQVKILPDFIFVKTPYHQKDLVQRDLNGVWSKKEQMYRFPKNLHCLRELARHFPQLQAVAPFLQTGQSLRAVREKALALKARRDFDTDQRLRPYQRVDVGYLLRLPAAGIFNEPRTGKTPTSIILMKELGTKRNLVVCPASLIWNWAKEFEQWMPEMEVHVIHGTPKQKKGAMDAFCHPFSSTARVMVISKDTWKSVHESWDDFTFDTVFVDEAHYLRNYKTAQSKAIFAIKAQKRYALTGTPTVKHAKDIWGILHFLYPKKFSSYWQFVERYFEMGEDYMGHAEVYGVKPTRQTELQELIGFASVQRKRKEVMQWLPDKERIPFFVVMEGRQKRLYDKMVEEFVAYDPEAEGDDNHIVDTPNVLSQLTRLRQLCLDPRLIGFDVRGAKTDALLEFLGDNVTDSQPVVIMSLFTSYLKMIKPEIEALGLKVGEINGEMGNKEKNQMAVRFQRGELDCLLCNIISAGVGFTLDKAETIIFMDKAWNPADNEQAEDRITPTVQEKNHKHSVISFIAQDSMDEKINKILDEKKSLTDVVNHGGREAITQLLRG